MNKIELEYPDGFRAIQKNIENGISITIEKERPVDIMEAVKSFQDAYLIADEKTQMEYHSTVNGASPAYIVALAELILIAKVINEGWVPDWNDTDKKKWHPWFNLSSGFGFDASYCDYPGTDTTVGSRLCFGTKEKSDYMGTQFQHIYKTALT